MRGARAIRILWHRFAGIIPADAGSTDSTSQICPSRGDHPRGCGEHTLTTSNECWAAGSSPRMRGALERCITLCTDVRITPADAGSTHYPVGRFGKRADHPRGCGEHHTQTIAVGSGLGSSPRMRGAQQLLTMAEQGGRIIPADAGSTLRVSSSDRACSDHPRGCGEHIRCGAKRGIPGGSSPRMRGAPSGIRGLPQKARIIPADAGSTLLLSTAYREGQDHPRGCGEHEAMANSQIENRGSSPRMRGAQIVEHGINLSIRIIPADAGSTHMLSLFSRLDRDHPRGCGEHQAVPRS